MINRGSGLLFWVTLYIRFCSFARLKKQNEDRHLTIFDSSAIDMRLRGHFLIVHSSSLLWHMRS